MLVSSLLLQAHLDISQEEKGAVCKYLNCQKLSQWACIDAVQNEMMPLRLIVQALFVQQLNTHQAFKECSDSFRYAQSGEFSGSLPSSRCPNTKSQYLADSPYMDGAEQGSRTLSFLLQKDIAVQRCEFSRKEYESTSFRIQSLEQELFSLKKSLQLQKTSKRTETLPTKPQSTKPYGLQSRSLSKNRNPLGHVTGCIGSSYVVEFFWRFRHPKPALELPIVLFNNLNGLWSGLKNESEQLINYRT
ncbi:hypothetical protein D5086_026906 [Populus alba]|uniref:Uncharacterized protein n=1 Tax=Populus alba TaxID=43335 RepID=A0ACC4B3K5_POPAL